MTHTGSERRATDLPFQANRCAPAPMATSPRLIWEGKSVARGRGFTLLEAVLALAMLTAVIVVCLQLRAQVGMVGRQVEKVAARDNAAEALFQSLVNGLLGAPVDSARPGAIMWEGVQNGAKYTVVRTVTHVPNPVVGQVDFDVPATLAAYRYEVTLGTTTSEFVWHR